MPVSSRRRSRALPALGVVAVLGIAGTLRFWGLGHPGTLVFDEIYYVRDAITQLAHGFPTVWPDDDPLMGVPYTDEASFAVHPPLGKWLIALGLMVFGDGTGWGWRSAVALTGVATVGVTMLLGWRVSRSTAVALLAGLLLAIDGVHVVLTRVALLDGFLAFFVVLGALFAWLDHERVVDRSRLSRAGLPVHWARPWLVAAGIIFGAAAAVKWSGLYALAAFLLLATARDLVVRLATARELRRALRANTQGAGAQEGSSLRGDALGSDALSDASRAASAPRPVAATAIKPAGGPAAMGRPATRRGENPGPTSVSGAMPRAASLSRAWGRAARQALAAGLLTLPAAFVTYVATWWGWITSTGGWGRDSTAWPVALWNYHVDMFEWHSTLSAPHPYQAHPITWPLGLRPTAMYLEDVGDGLVESISPLPNVLVTWGGVIALLLLSWWLVRALRRPSAFVRGPGRLGAGAYAAAFVVTGYLSGWLPWVLTLSRSAVFQFYAVVFTPFAALALALVIGVICRRGGDPAAQSGRRIAAGIFVAAAVIVSLLFFPVWSGMPVPEWFWQWHRWLPGWA